MDTPLYASVADNIWKHLLEMEQLLVNVKFSITKNWKHMLEMEHFHFFQNYSNKCFILLFPRYYSFLSAAFIVDESKTNMT